MSILPEGYSPVESMPLPEIKWYVLPGFKTFENAKAKVEDLIEKSGVATYEIHQQPDSFAILLPNISIQYLTKEEREGLVKNHRIKSEVNQPILWRFMSRKRVEKFFETGELRISTYAKYAEHDNPVRRDADEGKVTLLGAHGKLSCKMSLGVGGNALVLCTSLSQNNVLSKGEPYDACIEIDDLLSFVKVATIKLAEKVNVESVVHGACMYHNKEIQDKIRSDALEKIMQQTSGSNSFDFSLLSQLAGEIGGNKVFFSKPMDKQEECEYRIVWLTDKEQKEAIVIEIPEARAFCRPVYF